MRYSRKKYVPTFVGFNNYKCKHDDFYCYYEEAIWDKYGLHYTIHESNGRTEEVCLKGRRYSKPPYAFNSYEEMMEQTEMYSRACHVAHKVGNIRKEAVFLVLDLDENGVLHSDPFSLDGNVSKRGTVFNITGSGKYEGGKRFKLTQENKHLVFPNIGKAADYVYERYGRWAMSHYLKSFPGSL